MCAFVSKYSQLLRLAKYLTALAALRSLTGPADGLMQNAGTLVDAAEAALRALLEQLARLDALLQLFVCYCWHLSY